MLGSLLLRRCVLTGSLPLACTQLITTTGSRESTTVLSAGSYCTYIAPSHRLHFRRARTSTRPGDEWSGPPSGHGSTPWTVHGQGTGRLCLFPRPLHSSALVLPLPSSGATDHFLLLLSSAAPGLFGPLAAPNGQDARADSLRVCRPGTAGAWRSSRVYPTSHPSLPSFTCICSLRRPLQQQLLLRGAMRKVNFIHFLPPPCRRM